MAMIFSSQGLVERELPEHRSLLGGFT